MKFFNKWEVKQEHILLVLIFILALFLRVFKLSSFPNGFFTDEVVSGYVGRFLFENLHDPYGNFLPLFYFDKFGDFRSIIPMYLTGFSTLIFGVTEFAVRFPPALMGSLIIFPMYILSNKMLGNKKISLIASLFMAIIPWHIVLSRAQSEGIMGLTIFISGLAFLFPKKGISRKEAGTGALLLGLTYFFYPPFRIMAPLFILPFLIFSKNKKERVIYFIIFAFLMILSILVLSTPWGRGRAEQTSLFSNKEIAQKIQAENENSATAIGQNKVLLARIYHNKVIGYSREFAKQYFSYYSPTYLFFNGGLPYRYAIPEGGLLPLTFVIFFIGFIFLPKSNILSSKIKLFLLYTCIISVLPAALTFEDSPNIHRSFLMIIPLVILAAVGCYLIVVFFQDKKLRYLTLSVIGLLLIGELIYLQHQYGYQAPAFKSVLRGDGMKEASAWLAKNKDSYYKIYSTGYEDFGIYYLFTTKNFDKSLSGKFDKNPILTKYVDNINFYNDLCPFIHDANFKLKKDELLVVNGDCPGYIGYTPVHEVLRRDSTRAFRMLISD